MKLGLQFYGLGTALTGMIDIAWRAFDASHQPVKALGQVPFESVLGCLVGIWLVAAGLTILRPQSAKIGAAACGAAYLAFAALWVVRYIATVHAIGWRLNVSLAIAFGLAQQLLLISPAIMVYMVETARGSQWEATALRTARWLLGLPPILFGIFHIVGLRVFASIVPHWMHFGKFWAMLTGVAFMLAGLAICSGIQDMPAARLLALMLFLFEPLVEP